MKFYDRKDELAVLDKLNKQSEKTSCFTLLVGRRRLGKTALLMRMAAKQKHLYLFVSRQNERLLCEQFQKEAKSALGFEIFGQTEHFKDLFEALLRAAEKTPYTLIIDEFQEFERINPAIFSEIQNLWDKYKNKIKLNFITCGSIYSTLIKIFENSKEPLFGRLNSKIILKPFQAVLLKEILKDYNKKYTSEDLLCLYMLTGGVPKYISLLMDSKSVSKNKMIDFVIKTDSLFLSEGKDLLIAEFGKDYGTYFSILQLIANGKNTQSEIDSVIGKNTGAYLMNLEKEFALISRRKPLFSKPESRNGRWRIADNYLSFYFRFLYPNQTLIEQGQYELLKKIVLKGYEQYSGLVLENYFREKYIQSGKFTQAGSYWDTKGENEIDIIALDALNKTAVIAEVKRNEHKINLQQLAAKAQNLKKQLTEYKVEYKSLSLTDM
jgi:AAA+ ATPase superfamily predicted ATPase